MFKLEVETMLDGDQLSWLCLYFSRINYTLQPFPGEQGVSLLVFSGLTDEAVKAGSRFLKKRRVPYRVSRMANGER